ncbi:MAG: hypothetical protein AB1571_01575 [Nanoarchaeota archaeon]
MTTYFCKACNFRYSPKGARTPKICPACGRETIVRDYDANTILEEVGKENFFDR